MVEVEGPATPENNEKLGTNVNVGKLSEICFISVS